MVDAAPLDRRLPGLDGIRGQAVAVVLLFHAEIAGFGGAFLGISQFFTLSGFLITSILLRSAAGGGGIDLRAFWVRRFRRLLPAAYLALAGAVVLTLASGTAQQVARLPGDVLASIGSIVNWWFVAKGQSYVDLFSAPSPVQHFWSLAIEEQFYVLLPLALVVAFRRGLGARSLAWIAGGLAVASSALMVVLFETGASLDRLYYGTDTRASELLVGVALACVLHQRPYQPTARTRVAVSALAVLAVGAFAWGYASLDLTGGAVWRGGFLATSLLTVVVVLDVLGGTGPLARVLSLGPLAALGRISYGIYVFHWPVYLWLDAERTGLGQWPLLALRVAVTLTVAIASYHLLELPIRERRLLARRPQVRIAWPVAVVALAVAAFGTAQRDVADELAGLGQDPTDAAPAVFDADGPLRLLVVADEAGAAQVDALTALAATDDDLTVTVAPTFRCDGIDDSGPHRVCTNWADDWSGPLDAAQPDAVLFHVTDWDRQQLVDLAGTRGIRPLTDFTRDALEGAVDLLSSTGAPVVWSQAPVDIGGAIRVRSGPFFRAAVALTSARLDTRRLIEPVDDVTEALTEVRLFLGERASQATRVLVIGDSTARTFGYGLERWASSTDAALVWSAGIEGCGLLTEGIVRDSSGREVEVGAECASVADGWARQVAQFDPDVVLVSSQVFDLQARKLPGADTFTVPGDPAFDEFLVDRYLDVVDTLTAGGAQLVWFQNPCARLLFGTFGDPGALDLARIRYVNDTLLPQLAAARPQVHLFDVMAILCPTGEFQADVAGIANIRPDGVHLGSEGSLWMAETYGQQILDLAHP